MSSFNIVFAARMLGSLYTGKHYVTLRVLKDYYYFIFTTGRPEHWIPLELEL